MGNLEQKFKENLEAWRKHCDEHRYSSQDKDYIDCEAYRNIVAMGPAILPFIREAYAKPQDRDGIGKQWCYAIKEIVPEFNVPIGEEGSGAPIEKSGPQLIKLDINKIQDYTVKWLDENMDTHLKEKR